MIRPRMNSLAKHGSGPGFKRLAKVTKNICMVVEVGVSIYPVYGTITRMNEAKGPGEGRDTAISRYAGKSSQELLSGIHGARAKQGP